MAIDLDWLLQEQALPEPEAPAFVAPVAQPGVNAGEVSLGCGLVAPFRRDGKGDFNNGCAEPLIRASVERILGVVAMTDVTRGELEWMPEFGTRVHHIRHRMADDGTAELARYHVLDALRIWEPRIVVKDGRVEYVERNDPGSSPGVAMEIRVLYDIVGRRRGAGVLVPGVNQLVTISGIRQAA